MVLPGFVQPADEGFDIYRRICRSLGHTFVTS
jgi:hypothetical protein